jgi:hypothetical protein
MTRPREIGRFEMMALAACIVDVVATLIAIHFLTKGIVTAAIGSAIAAALILWVSRGRSLIGRVVLTIWLGLGIAANVFAYGATLLAGRLAHADPTLLGLSLIGFALNCVALVFVWSRPSTEWLRTKTV